jgi:small subunit ribosomal protein S16
VVQEHTAPIKGKFVENLGYFKPAEDPKVFKVDLERVKYWLSVGAQPSDTVAVWLKREGVEGMEKYIDPRDKQRKKKKEVPEEAPPAPAAPAAPAEEPAAEEAPKEEAPAAPAEESAAEEAPKEEAPAEEPATEEKPE